MVKLSTQTAFSTKNYLKENLLEYHKSLPYYAPENSKLANLLKKKALKESIPIISDDVFCFLSQLVLLKNPMRILEIGTGGCYSTLALLEYFTGDDLISLDVSDNAIMDAHDLKETHDIFKKVQFVFCNAIDYLHEYQNSSFDLIFVDARKKHYKDFLKLSVPLLKRGGTILFDNLYFSGHVCRTAQYNPLFENKVTILKEFNKLFLDEKNLTASIYPFGDGLGIGVKK
ncbi:MAG: class I SAM-dependent methyltransferase [Nitrospinae bacterium]|nr:class I SAM-dependent methyltransferase [Nitrospinota bacterium]